MAVTSDASGTIPSRIEMAETLCRRCRDWYAQDGVCPRCDGLIAWRRACRAARPRRRRPVMKEARQAVI